MTMLYVNLGDDKKRPKLAAKMAAFMATAGASPEVYDLYIYHDNDCLFFKWSGDCDCQPDFRLELRGSKLPEPTEP